MSDDILIVPGDVWVQKAQIVEILLDKENQESDNDKLTLNVSDSEGRLTKTTTMPRHLFKKQFSPDPDVPSYFIRQVRVEQVESEGRTVLVTRINDKGDQISDQQRILKKIFLETYYLPLHQMGHI